MFHYKQSLRRQLAKLGLYKSVYKLEKDEILKICGKIPFILNNKNNEFDKIIKTIEKNELYSDFLNYLKNQWFQYLKKKFIRLSKY